MEQPFDQSRIFQKCSPKTPTGHKPATCWLRGAASGRSERRLGPIGLLRQSAGKRKSFYLCNHRKFDFLSATILATIIPEIMVSIPLRVICLLTENRDNIKGGVLKDV